MLKCYNFECIHQASNCQRDCSNRKESDTKKDSLFRCQDGKHSVAYGITPLCLKCGARW